LDFGNPAKTALNPIHWFQFEDDAAVVSGQEKEKPNAPQSLYNLVSVGSNDNTCRQIFNI
jgi:hypothetical protein